MGWWFGSEAVWDEVGVLSEPIAGTFDMHHDGVVK
jgi:hypothetical protein